MGGTTTAVRPAGLRTETMPVFATTGMQRWLDRQFTRVAVVPTTVMMLVIFGIPLAFSFYLSFQGWSPDQSLFAGKFAGFANYEDLLTDPQFLNSLSVTLHLHRDHRVAAELACGLGIALLLNIDLPWIGAVPHRAGGADDDHPDRRARCAGSCCSTLTTAWSTTGSAATSSGSAGRTPRCCRSWW